MNGKRSKEFTLRVCPYFGVRGYQPVSDEQAKVMASDLHSANFGRDFEAPDEFVAIKVKGFHGEPTEGGLLYVPCRQYTRIEYWRDRSCYRVIENEAIESELKQGLKIASENLSIDGISDLQKKIAEISLDGTLNGHWPWEQKGLRESLLERVRIIAREASKDISSSPAARE